MTPFFAFVTVLNTVQAASHMLLYSDFSRKGVKEMPSVIELDEMRNIAINNIDRNLLVDIKLINLDSSLPITTRMLTYLEQIKNPYCFLCGETPVRVRFSDTGKTLDEAIKSHFWGLKAL